MKFDNNQRNRKIFLVLIALIISFVMSSLLLLGAIKGMGQLVGEQSASLNEVNESLQNHLDGVS